MTESNNQTVLHLNNRLSTVLAELPHLIPFTKWLCFNCVSTSSLFFNAPYPKVISVENSHVVMGSGSVQKGHLLCISFKQLQLSSWIISFIYWPPQLLQLSVRYVKATLFSIRKQKNDLAVLSFYYCCFSHVFCMSAEREIPYLSIAPASVFFFPYLNGGTEGFICCT